MKKEESFDVWFDRVYGWYKKNKERSQIDKHSEKISYSREGEDKHIVRHESPKKEHIIEHGHNHHEIAEMATLPEPDDEKSLQEWVEKIHKLWEEHS